MHLSPAPLALAGVASAAAVAFVAWKAGALSASGALAAAVVGALAVASRWEWAAVLMIFFVTSTAISRVGHATKQTISRSRTAKTGPRDVWQVLANGGVFAGAAFAAATTGDWRLSVAALAAIATANGDTWATEVGVLLGRRPRSIVSWRVVPAGTSGGISLPGTLAGVSGVLLIGAAAAMLQIHQNSLIAIVAGGLIGFFSDSVFGATVQSQRWCEQCCELTERPVHSCGTRTSHRSGLRWLNNDGVNALATSVGAIAAVILASA